MKLEYKAVDDVKEEERWKRREEEEEEEEAVGRNDELGCL